MQLLSVPAPVQIDAGIQRNMGHGNGTGVAGEGDVGSGPWHGCDVDFEKLVEGDPAVVGRGDEVIGVGGAEVYALVMAIQINAHVPSVQGSAGMIENAVAGGVEGGSTTRPGDQFLLASCYRHGVNPGVFGPGVTLLIVSVFATKHNRATIRRKSRLPIDAFLRGDCLWTSISTVQVEAHDATQIGIAPGYVHKGASVGRKYRFKFEIGAAGEALWRAIGQGFGPQISGCVENQDAPVGGGCGMANDARGESVGRRIVFHGEGFGHGVVDAGLKRDDAGFEGFGVQLADFPLRPEYEVLAVGHPVEIGVRTKNGPGFLLVATEVVVNGSFNARFEVTNEHDGLLAHPANEGHFGAVGR